MADLQYEERTIRVNRVAKVVKGGRRFSFAALMVVGDGNGKVGLGYGKAKEAGLAVQKGIEEARKNLFEVPLAGTTIVHPVIGRSGAGRVMLKPEMRVLIAEDERRLADAIARGLRREGMAVDLAPDGSDALVKARIVRYDVVVLDRDLPGVHGDEVCRAVRVERPETGILMLTAAGTLHDVIEGLGLGADDYLAKPFRMEELLARLRALIRRASGQVNPQLRCGDLILDPRAGKVTMGGTSIRLTSHEFRVLSYLMHHPDRVVSQSELTEHIYAQRFDRDSNTVEVFIARLRRKLGPSFIETVRGLGYRIRATS